RCSVSLALLASALKNSSVSSCSKPPVAPGGSSASNSVNGRPEMSIAQLPLEVDVPVAGHQVEHVVEKSHARAARARAGAFEGQLEANVCLAGPALDLGVAAHGSPFSRTRASIDSACTSKPSARASGAPAAASLAAAG